VAKPNRTFALLVVLSVALVTVIGWSTHHLLLAGAPALAAGAAWPGFSCLLLPLADDFTAHLASYVFLLAIVMGTVSGLRTLIRQHRQTRDLLRACLATRSPRRRAVDQVAQRLGLDRQVDIADIPGPVAFCYGYLRPRVLISRHLVEMLTGDEMEALLLHEREHVRQRDPLKVAGGELLASAGFFLPILGGLHRRYLIEKELAADRAAITEQGSAASLMAALVRLVDHRAAPETAPPIGAAGALEVRIATLVGDPVRLDLRLGPAGLVGSLVAALLAVLPLLTSPLPVDVAASSHNVVAGCHLAT